MNSIRLFRISIATFLLLFLASPVWAQGFDPDEEQKKFIEEQMEVTKDRLQLTDDQLVAVEEILLGSFTEREEIKEKYGMNPQDPDFKRPKRKTAKSFRSDMDHLADETTKQLSKHLTADQMERWEVLEKERADRMRDQIRNR